MNTHFDYKTILIACLIVSIGQLSMGLVFPALPWVAQDFAITLDDAQLLVGIYLLGFGPSQFIYGPVSDAIGRKKVLLFGLLIALLGLMMIIWLQHSFIGMVAGRFLQGLGTGCCAVLARATIRDRYSSADLPTAMSYVAMVASFTPVIAPVLGGFINAHFGWSMVFVSLFGYVILTWSFLAVTFKEKKRVSAPWPSLPTMAKQYWTLLRSRYFMSFAMITWLNFSLMITTVSIMPFIMQQHIGMTSDKYALWALIPAIGMLMGTSLSNRLRVRFKLKQVLLITPCLHLAAAIWLWFCPLDPLYLMLGQWLMIFGNGIALPCAQSMVLLPYKKQAGAAAAMSGGGQMVFTSFVSMLLVAIGASQVWHLAVIIFLFAGITTLCIIHGFNQPQAAGKS